MDFQLSAQWSEEEDFDDLSDLPAVFVEEPGDVPADLVTLQKRFENGELLRKADLLAVLEDWVPRIGDNLTKLLTEQEASGKT
jgi:hypothetical protein